MQQFNSLTIEEYNNSALTLVELLVAICIFTFIAIGFSSIDTFNRYHIAASDRRVKLENDATYVLKHMTKQIGQAIGDVTNAPVVIDDSNRRIKVYLDLAADGQSPGNGRRDPEGTEGAGDHWIAYWWRDSSAPAADQYQIWYCPQCTDSPCNTCNPAWGTPDNILSNKINSFSPTYILDANGYPVNNYIEIQLSACWDPDGSPVACATLDNPSLTIKNRIYMPAVSNH